MRLLCISAFCPHGRADSAGVLDVHQMLRYLGVRHAVTVVTPVNDADRAVLGTLQEVVERVVAVPGSVLDHGVRHAAFSAMSLATPWPAIALLNNARAFRRAIADVSARGDFDVALMAFTQTMHLRSLLPPGLPAVIDESDIAFERRRRFADTVSNPLVRAAIVWDCWKLRRYELGWLQQFDGVLVRTRREAEMLRRLAALREPLVMPPWVDVSFRSAIPGKATARDVLFFGALWRPVNDDAAQWMAREVFPRVRSRVPDARLLLVGSRPSAAVRALASDAVEVPGFVESIAPYYERSAVVVAPLRAGSGIKGKVLQALGAGRPVVATPVGAEGIGATEQDGLFVREMAASFADQVVALLTDPHGTRWHTLSRKYFERSYDWERSCRSLEQLLVGLAARAVRR